MPKSNVSPKPAKKSAVGKTSNYIRTFIFFIFIVLICSALINSFGGNGSLNLETVPISSVIARANDPEGDISKITVEGDSLKITLKGKETPTQESVKDPAGTLYDQGLVDYCSAIEDPEAKATCKQTYPTIEYIHATDVWGTVLDVGLIVLPVLALILFFSYMMRQAQSMNSQNIGFGKAKARVYGPDKKKVTFKDVAGNESAKQDLSQTSEEI